MIFDHIQIKVLDYKISRAFFEKVLGALGYAIVFEIENVVTGFGTSVHDMFEVRVATEEFPPSQSTHIAFTAPSEEAVRAFYEIALANGAKDNGAPGYRPEYEEGYYAVFVIDPNGHNLEAVYKK